MTLKTSRKFRAKARPLFGQGQVPYYTYSTDRINGHFLGMRREGAQSLALGAAMLLVVTVIAGC